MCVSVDASVAVPKSADSWLSSSWFAHLGLLWYLWGMCALGYLGQGSSRPLKSQSLVLTRTGILTLQRYRAVFAWCRFCYSSEKNPPPLTLSLANAVMQCPLQLESHPAFSAFLLIYSNAFHEICNFIRFSVCFLAVLSYPQPQALYGWGCFCTAGSVRLKLCKYRSLFLKSNAKIRFLFFFKVFKGKI